MNCIIGCGAAAMVLPSLLGGLVVCLNRSWAILARAASCARSASFNSDANCSSSWKSTPAMTGGDDLVPVFGINVLEATPPLEQQPFRECCRVRDRFSTPPTAARAYCR